jgi:zinc protease
VPIDSLVRITKLPNGLTVYIRKNGWPEERSSIRLAVKAGSVLEDDDQQGLAHLLEHMCFNGTKHFKAGDLVAYLESIGARFGADANAFTSFDETVYILEVPTDRDSLMDKGLLIMSDYAARATLSDEEIEKERGVVLEEWRLGRGADNRIRDKQYPVMYHGSRYAARLPIGKPEIIQKAPSGRLRDFYGKWYRPERMAVVAVGDFDVARVEELIQTHFGDIPPSANLPELPLYEVPPHDETLFAIATDPEARFSSVTLMYKHPRAQGKTYDDWRRELVERLFLSLLNERLFEQSRTLNAPFVSAFSRASRLGRTVDTFSLWAQVEDGRIPQGLKALLTEVDRVQEHGFGETELERIKKSVLARAESRFNERDRTENGSLARECVAHFLDGEKIPGVVGELQFLREVLPTITLDDVARAARRLIHQDNRVVLASAPEKEGLRPPSEDELRALIEGVSSAIMAEWVDKTPGRALMEETPVPGTVSATRTLPELGVTVLALSNGVEVWLKPTDFKNDQILFSSYALGGASLAEPENYNESVRVPALLGETGIGGFTPVELEKLLAGVIAQGTPYISEYTHGLNGSCTPKDLETALQLIHLTCTKPTDRPEGFEVMVKRLRTSVAHRADDPDALYSEKIQELISSGHYMARPLTPQGVDAMRYEPALRFYKERFSNAADFTFFFVGAFQIEKITPLLARYLGSLPSEGKRTSKFMDRGYRFPTGVHKAAVNKGREPKSRTALHFFADTGLDEMEMHRARAAANILRMRLREILREDLGATYGVSVGYLNAQPLPGYGSMAISFGSAPENVDRMVEAVFKELEVLRSEGPKPDEIQRVQETERRELETAEKQNGYWMGSLQTVHMMGWDPLRILNRRDRIDLLNKDNMREMFRKYFPVDRFVQVSLFPENGERTAAGSGR